MDVTIIVHDDCSETTFELKDASQAAVEHFERYVTAHQGREPELALILRVLLEAVLENYREEPEGQGEPGELGVQNVPLHS